MSSAGSNKCLDESDVLGTAIRLKQPAALERILAKRADPNNGRFGELPLQRASTNGDVKIIKLLLKHNAQVDAVDSDQRTSLFSASQNCHFEVVRLLLGEGADANWQRSWLSLDVGHDEDDFADCPPTPLYDLILNSKTDGCSFQERRQVMDLLIKKNATLDYKNCDYGGMLLETVLGATNLDLSAMRLSFMAGAAANTSDVWKELSNKFATWSDTSIIEAAKLLVDNGGDINTILGRFSKVTVLGKAVESCRVALVQCFLRLGAHEAVSQRCADSETAGKTISDLLNKIGPEQD